MVHPLPDRLKLGKNNTRAHVIHRRSLAPMHAQSLKDALEEEKRSDSWCGVEGIIRTFYWHIFLIWLYVSLGNYAIWGLSLLCCIFTLTINQWDRAEPKPRPGLCPSSRTWKQLTWFRAFCAGWQVSSLVALIDRYVPTLDIGWHIFQRVALVFFFFFLSLSTAWHDFPRFIHPVIIFSRAYNRLTYACFPVLGVNSCYVFMRFSLSQGFFDCEFWLK